MNFINGLIFLQIRGNFAVGSHVRDAACYVFWAFARAFDPSVIAPYVTQLAPSLVCTMLFDREVNLKLFHIRCQKSEF